MIKKIFKSKLVKYKEHECKDNLIKTRIFHYLTGRVHKCSICKKQYDSFGGRYK